MVLTRVEAKLDTATTGVADHEVRLRRLESRFWMAMGAASVLGAGGGAGIAQLIGR
ncbi:hypothetical protein [Streptomyces sp. HYC2]|uniref:hypothetical protein n=1 Tax=Streptomyces sp. HYC2 TaxID=2955207 RepID=UPI0024804F39|nr:hypothetical protein [Streptomyces sp. HYC2]